MISLVEAARLVETLDEQGVQNSVELREFSDGVQTAGIKVLEPLGESYIKDLTEFVAGTIAASLEERAGLDGMFINHVFTVNPEILVDLSMDVLKVCIGLAALEEIR